MGWRYMSLWTIEVFTDPSSCADRIGSYLGLETVSRKYVEAEQGFLDQQADELDTEESGPEDAGTEEPTATEPTTTEPDGGQLEVERTEHSPDAATESRLEAEKHQESE
jgi:hypothetical protein